MPKSSTCRGSTFSRMDVIETKRLLLEPLDVSRVEEFVALSADAEVMRYWGPEGSRTAAAAQG